MGTTVYKQLATTQDLALGSGKVIQQRNGKSIELDKISMVKYINNIEDLLAITDIPINEQTVSVLGYRTIGDGGGQVLYWDSASVENPNNFTIFKVTSILTGRWKSKDTTILNIKHGGAYVDGTTDDSFIAQGIMDYLNSIGGGTIRLPLGTTYWATQLELKLGVNIIGEELSGSIISSGAPVNSLFAPDGSFIRYARYEEFTITHKDSTQPNNSVTAIDFIGGISQSTLRFRIETGLATLNGCRIRGINSVAVANNNQYGNRIDLRIEDEFGVGDRDGIALWLSGGDIPNARCNANTIAIGKFDGFKGGLSINGNGNLVGAITVNGPASNFGIRFEGNGTFGNLLTNPYLDAAITGDKIQLEYTTDPVGTLHMMTLFETVTATSPSQIIDVSAGSRKAVYSMQSRGRVFPGGTEKVFTPGDTCSGVVGLTDDDVLHFSSTNGFTGAGIMAAGPDVADGGNAVAQGGLSVRVNESTGEWRVVTTTNGVSFTPVFKVGSKGAITSPSGASVTMNASANSKVISSVNVTANSQILITADDPSAGAFLATHGVHTGNLVAGTSFTIFSSDSSNFAGTEEFAYLIIN